MQTVSSDQKIGRPDIIRFVNDMTLMWPCRPGDIVLWMRFASIFSSPPRLEIPDFWQMRAGYSVTITNRPEDFPAEFQLHPTEVCDSLAFKMVDQIKRGHYPPQPIDGPNLWRLKVGDRLAWVGPERPGRPSTAGLLAVVDFQECALAVGEGASDLETFMTFGAPYTQEDAETIASGHAAVEFVRGLGLPFKWGPEWRIG